MHTSETVNAQITLPSALYKAIEQQAKKQGHSLNSEIVALLSSLLPQLPEGLSQEFKEWEAASDEDWAAFENTLAAEEN